MVLQAADAGSGGRWVVWFLGSLKAMPNWKTNNIYKDLGPKIIDFLFLPTS